MTAWLARGLVLAAGALSLAAPAAPSFFDRAASAGAGAPPRSGLTVELAAASDAAVPGKALQLGLKLRHAPGWHTYWRNPGVTGYPASAAWTLPEGWTVAQAGWPAPARSVKGGITSFVYTGETVLPFDAQVPAAASGAARISAKVEWLACKEICVPGEAEVSLALPVAAEAGPSKALWVEASRA
ncbi:MAG: hypothetical protein HUK26_03785, partial [Duodenibacillus sp.]|nr:hypothetical protein [Duodenibacillus sp.]